MVDGLTRRPTKMGSRSLNDPGPCMADPPHLQISLAVDVTTDGQFPLDGGVVGDTVGMYGCLAADGGVVVR